MTELALVMIMVMIAVEMGVVVLVMAVEDVVLVMVVVEMVEEVMVVDAGLSVPPVTSLSVSSIHYLLSISFHFPPPSLITHSPFPSLIPCTHPFFLLSLLSHLPRLSSHHVPFLLSLPFLPPFSLSLLLSIQVEYLSVILVSLTLQLSFRDTSQVKQ